MSELDSFKEIKNSIEQLLEMLEANGWELNDDGDIVEKSSQKLVFDLYFSRDDDDE